MSACPNGLGCPGCPHPIPWVPYTNESLRFVTLCEETGRLSRDDGRCSVHGGDACLYVYRHPDDNAIDRWKKAKQWGKTAVADLPSTRSEDSSP